MLLPFRLPTLCGAVLVALGATVLLGSVLAPVELLRLAPALGAMGLTTALAFLILGGALAMDPTRHGGACLGAAAAVFILVALRLAGWWLGPRGVLGIGDAWPGKMSSMTGAALLAAAAIVALLPHQRRGLAIGATLALVAALATIGLLPLFGHAFGIALFYASSSSAQMTSLPTAAGLLALAAGLVALLAGNGDLRAYYRQREDRRIFLTTILLMYGLVLTAGLVVAGLVAQQNIRAVRDLMGQTVRANAALLESQLRHDLDYAAQVVRQSRLARLLADPATRNAWSAQRDELARWAGALADLRPVSIVLLNEAGAELAWWGDSPAPEATLVLNGEGTAALRWAGEWQLEIRVPLAVDGTTVGQAVVVVSEAALEQRLLVRPAEAGRGGSVQVCGRNPGGVADCLPLRLSLGLVQLVPRVDDDSRPMAEALAGGQGVMMSEGGSRAPLLAGYAAVGGLGLALVQKVDSAEIFEPVRDRLLLAMVALLLIIAGGALALYWRIFPLLAERSRAEDALRRWRQVFQYADWGVVIGSADGQRLEMMNPAFARMHGYEVWELIGRPIADVFAPEVQAAIAGQVGVARETGHHRFESLHQRRDGSTFPVLVDVAAVRNDRGEVLFRAVNVQDISDLKATEAALRQSEGLLRQVLDTLPVGVWIADERGHITQGNPAAVALWGGEQLAGLGQYGQYLGWWAGSGEALSPGDWPVVRAVRQGQVSIGEIIDIKTFDGRRKTIRYSAVPLRTADGAIEGAVAVNEDITATRRIEEDLRLNKEFLENVFESSPVGIVICDIEGRFLRANHAFSEVIGYGEEELLALSIHELMPPQERVDGAARMREALAGDVRAYYLENRLLHKRGRPIWALLAMALVRDRQGKPLYFIGQLLDITERKRIEVELEASRRQLRELAAHAEAVREEERKRIAREVHDELGQLLTGLKMDVSLLRLTFGDNPALLEKLAGMRTLVEKTIGVVRHVASNLRPAALDLGLAAALEWLAEDFTRHAGIACTVRIGEEEGAGAADGQDEARATALFRIVQESLTNVARHARAKAVEIVLERRGSMLVLTVRDDGRGFDPAKAVAGGGFGLLSLRERAEAAGGICRIESAPGRGTMVYIGLPVLEMPRS